jgi:hypothetical protein
VHALVTARMVVENELVDTPRPEPVYVVKSHVSGRIYGGGQEPSHKVRTDDAQRNLRAVSPAVDDSDGADRIYARPHNAFLSARNISNFAASDTAFPIGK